MKNRLSHKKPDVSTVFVTALMGLWGLLIVYPYYNALIASLASQKEYMLNPLILFPRSITLDAYRFLLKGTNLMAGYQTHFFCCLSACP